MNKEPRFKMGMPTVEYVLALAEGIIGAIDVLIQMTARGSKIDPQAAFGDLSHLFLLDEFEIYGERIWMLYKDVCKQSLVLTAAALRAVQLGIISRKELDHAIDNRGEGINPVHLYEEVCDTLDKFDRGSDEQLHSV